MGTTGWHIHPGPAVVSVTEGELELVNARDCVTRTYRASDAFIDPGQGNVHTGTNPSEEERRGSLRDLPRRARRGASDDMGRASRL